MASPTGIKLASLYVIAVIAAGAVFGAVIGAMFPRVFGFIFEMFLDI